MASAPAYAANVRIDHGQVATANTNRDGTGTLATIATGVAAGTLVYSVRVQATVTTTAGMVRLFISTDGGTTKRLVDEIPISAVTVAANTPAFSDVRVYEHLFLPSTNAVLYASTHNAEAINVLASCGDLT